MTKDGTTDQERLRDEFEGGGQTPVLWQLQARSHLSAANVLLERAQWFVGNSVAPPDAHDPPHLRMMPAYLLFGYALENLVKGLLIARGETPAWSRSQSKGMKHHGLTWLFRVASVKTTPREDRLLEDLGDAIESEKYPVGVRPRARKRSLGADPVSDAQGVFALFGRMEQTLRQVCLDSVHPPCEPPRLGVLMETADLQDVLIPETCEDALERWDAGEFVWSAEMGGLGPSYEQAIHLMAFECVRYLMDKEMPDLNDAEGCRKLNQEMTRVCINAAVEAGLSSPSRPQALMARNVASVTKRNGWRSAIRTLPPERRILVKKAFP